MGGSSETPWWCGWDPRKGLACWLGFWKTPRNSARLGAAGASSLSFLTVQRGHEDPHFTEEKTEDVKFVARVTQLGRGIQPRQV